MREIDFIMYNTTDTLALSVVSVMDKYLSSLNHLAF